MDKDTIYRQDAIDAICNACGKIDCDKMDKCEKLQLPPANCSEIPNNSDTISRQAAIDAAREELESGTYFDIPSKIEGMPPAQPELCEDAVSRAKINAFCHIIIKRDPDGDNDIVKAFEAFRAYVNSLPSVTPKPRTGEWEIYVISMLDGEGCRCSECGFEGAPYWDFCPNCGSYNGGEQDEID